MAKIADPKPVVCCVCLQPPMVRDHELAYVDFETSYDGPVVTRYGERAESGQTIATPVDDLVMCEECLRAGALLIDMEPKGDTGMLIADKDRMIQNLKVEVAAKDRAISDLSHSVGVVIDHPVKRPARPPKVTGPDSHADGLKKVRSNRRTAAKISKTMKEKQR
jgi:hypothetical protein